MKKCVHCGKKLPAGQRKYCDKNCSAMFKSMGPQIEAGLDRYEEKKAPNVDLLDDGAWLMFRSNQTDDQCIGDFMRVFKRAPEHVIYDPRTPWWKFAGPVWTNEELDHRWRM